MSEKPQETQPNGDKKKYLKFIGGCFMVVGGITMILLWFDDLAALMRGSVGFITALGGLLLLYSIKD